VFALRDALVNPDGFALRGTANLILWCAPDPQSLDQKGPP
jgi:hypothetical protein